MLKLFWTKALPLHYVAKDEAGVRWMIPVTPIAPHVRPDVLACRSVGRKRDAPHAG